MVNVEKLLKYLTIFPLFNFINDELTFILTPLIFKWLYQIRKKYINNG